MTPTGSSPNDHDVGSLLRRGILALAALGTAGTLVELAFLRHWDGATQLIAWPVTVTLALAVALVSWRAARGRVLAGRMLALGVVAFSGVGVALHVLENLDAGPLDRAFAATWDGLGALTQWWLAVTGGVGPAPVLAPAILAQVGLLVVLATVRHPALDG